MAGQLSGIRGQLLCGMTKPFHSLRIPSLGFLTLIYLLSSPRHSKGTGYHTSNLP